MGSDFNVGATSAQFWRGEILDDGVGIGEWCFNQETLAGSISACTPDGERSNLISLIEVGDRIQFTAVEPLRQILLRIDTVTLTTDRANFTVLNSAPEWIPVGTLTVVSLIKGVALDLILTDEMGEILVDQNGTVLYEDN